MATHAITHLSTLHGFSADIALEALNKINLHDLEITVQQCMYISLYSHNVDNDKDKTIGQGKLKIAFIWVIASHNCMVYRVHSCEFHTHH